MIAMRKFTADGGIRNSDSIEGDGLANCSNVGTSNGQIESGLVISDSLNHPSVAKAGIDINDRLPAIGQNQAAVGVAVEFAGAGNITSTSKGDIQVFVGINLNGAIDGE